MENKKVALVTGANRGLGLGTATDLAKRGFVVFMTGRNLEKIEAAAAQVRAVGCDARAFELDVTHSGAATQLAQAIRDEFGHLDILVNNAGVYLEPSNPETVLQTFQINTLGPLQMIQVFASLLRESSAGRVVNVSSGMGQLSEMQGSATGYRLSKAALNAVTRIMAAEFAGTSVKVNSVCPGWVRTDMGGPSATRELAEGVASITWAAFIGQDGPTGGFFRDGKRLDW